MIAVGLSHRRAVHVATVATALIGLVAIVVTAAPAQAATGTLDVIFQGTPLGSTTLWWNGDASCKTVTLPPDATGSKMTNHTDRSITVYTLANCQGDIKGHVGVNGTSLGPPGTLSFQPLP